MIWAYSIPTADKGLQTAYGTPVNVHIPGKGLMQVVYQFGDPERPCAVVHFESGMMICRVKERHHGYPEQRAQAACKEWFDAMPRTFATDTKIVATIDGAPVLNMVPNVVGVLKRWPPCT